MSAENEQSENGGGVATSSERLVDLYTEMVQIRLFEEACQRGFRQGKIGGYLHVYIGQEAVATGFLDTFTRTGRQGHHRLPRPRPRPPPRQPTPTR